mgnify:FL=1
MKREIAAICAALLFLTSCSANGASTQEMPAAPVEESQTQKSNVQADSQDIVTLPSVVEGQKPVIEGESSVEDASDLPVPDSFTDEPYEVQMDQEEIVSMSLVLPYFRLGSENVEQKINVVFMELQLNLQDYMGTTVYEAAQERHTLAFLDGDYTASLDDGILTVTYTVTERYADADGETQHENVYRFDARTGERLDA